ncbi:hypothetical protein AVEN_113410-1, partial [Araneus ventricosus]
PLKPDLFRMIRHELDSPNLGGHLPHQSTPAITFPKAHGNGLWVARIIGPLPLLSPKRSQNPKRSQPPQTVFRRC